jgi:hypothetical protein
MTAPLLGWSPAHQSLQEDLFDHLRTPNQAVERADHLSRIQLYLEGSGGGLNNVNILPARSLQSEGGKLRLQRGYGRS